MNGHGPAGSADRSDRRTDQRPDEPDTPLSPLPPDEVTVHSVLDLALRIGEIQLASGVGAVDVTTTVLGGTSALGLPHCEVDVVHTSITATCLRGNDLPSITSMGVWCASVTADEVLARTGSRS